jgi:hypothetical protein
MPHRDALKPRPAPTRPTITGLLPTDAAPSGKSYGQRIIDQIRAGDDIVNAARSTGVSMAQLGEWTREGAIHYARYLAGADWATEFTAAQQDAVWFHTNLDQAQAQHKSGLAIGLEQHARGGLTKTSKRTKRLAGDVIEETVTTEVLLPDAHVAMWKLERLQPDVYGRRGRIDLMLHDLTDTDDQGDVFEQRLAAIRRQLGHPDAIEATATEEVSGG